VSIVSPAFLLANICAFPKIVLKDRTQDFQYVIFEQSMNINENSNYSNFVVCSFLNEKNDILKKSLLEAVLNSDPYSDELLDFLELHRPDSSIIENVFDSLNGSQKNLLVSSLIESDLPFFNSNVKSILQKCIKSDNFNLNIIGKNIYNLYKSNFEAI